MTKSNIHNILSTFTSMGYLDRLPDGRYTLGLKILEYAFIINQNLGYPNAVYDILVDTAGKTNEIVYFGLPYGTNVLYLYVCGCSCVQLCRQAGGRGEHLRPGHYHDGREADGVRRHPAKCGPAHAGAHLPLNWNRGSYHEL